MVDIAEVRLWGERAGAVVWDNQRRLGIFEYDPAFLKKGLNLSPLYMPLSNDIFSFPELNRKTFYGLPGLLADSLPDEFGNKVIDQWVKKNKLDKHSFTPVDRLCYVGKRGMGALEFEPATDRRLDETNELEIEQLVELSSKILNAREEFSANLNNESGMEALIKVGTSAGGQRPKAIIAYNKNTGEVRSGQVSAPEGFTYWIMKLDGVSNQALGDPLGYGRIEYAYYLMALDCNIEMMESHLFEENGRAHFMTKRFDRSDSFEKFHIQTLCALAHFDYNSPAQYSYEDAFEVMRRLRLPHAEAVQLFRRMVFNVITRNQDDHTKNISFIMNKNGQWKLAPAYDVIYAYNPDGVWTSSHQMSINGKTDQFVLDDLLAVANEISLKKGKQIIEELIHTVQNWHLFAEEAGVPENQAASIEKTFRLTFD